ncbi:MAG TPA: hypothetical protein VLY03_03055 [Bacteroidota bacterium]|nr:hypothetical protein [Bacteroidota bacterium]
MKRNMWYVAVMALLAVGYLNAQEPYFSDSRSYQSANLDKVSKRFLECLSSTNEGVLESALAHIGRMKLYRPEYRNSALEAKVELLANENPSSKIRYRAYLVSNVLKSPSSFSGIAQMDFAGADELYSAIAGRLEQTMLGSANAVTE